MTNAEKFKEVFGFKFDDNRMSICMNFENCKNCPFSEEPSYKCVDLARSWWNEEYISHE